MNSPDQTRLFRPFIIGQAKNNIKLHSLIKNIWPLICMVLSRSLWIVCYYLLTYKFTTSKSSNWSSSSLFLESDPVFVLNLSISSCVASSNILFILVSITYFPFLLVQYIQSNRTTILVTGYNDMEEEENGQLQTDLVHLHKTFGRNQESNSTHTHTVQAQYCKAQITNSKVYAQNGYINWMQVFSISKMKLSLTSYLKSIRGLINSQNSPIFLPTCCGIQNLRALPTFLTTMSF